MSEIGSDFGHIVNDIIVQLKLSRDDAAEQRGEFSVELTKS